MSQDCLNHNLTLSCTVDGVGTSLDRLLTRVGPQISVSFLTTLNRTAWWKCSQTGFNESLHPFSDYTECLFEPGRIWWVILSPYWLFTNVYILLFEPQIHFTGHGFPRPKFVSPRKSESWSYLNSATQISSRTWKRTCMSYSRYCDPGCWNQRNHKSRWLLCLALNIFVRSMSHRKTLGLTEGSFTNKQP